MPAEQQPTGGAEPDYGVVGNAELHDGGPRYTETPRDPYAPDAPFVAEPWNAVTAALFVVVAGAWLVRLRGRYAAYPFLMCCLPILLVGGVGGTLYHGLRTQRVYFLLDVIPIQVLALAGAVFLAIKLWHRRGWLYLAGGVVVYLGVASLLFTLVLPRGRQLAINLNYAALATVVVLPMLLVLIRTRFRHGAWVAAGLVSFVIAWFFRLLDQDVGVFLPRASVWLFGCDVGVRLPMGSHWLWHTFGAITTALVIEYFYLMEGEQLLMEGEELTPSSPPAAAGGLSTSP
jgi:hypothetical protein